MRFLAAVLIGQAVWVASAASPTSRSNLRLSKLRQAAVPERLRTTSEDRDIPGNASDRGLIASPILHGQAVKSVYFFAGNWRHGWTGFPPDPPISDNTALYTMYSHDARHLGWSETRENRAFALDEMQKANINTITMSYWGPPSEDRWQRFGILGDE